MGQKSHLRNKDVTKLQKWKKNRPHREIKKTVKIPKRKEKRQTPLQDKKSKKEKRKKDYEVIKFIN